MTDMVGDEEWLYRRAPARWEPRLYTRDVDGNIVVSSSAFLSRGDISVDRALLCELGFATSQSSPDDGVIGLVAGAIRALSVSTNDREGRSILAHSADVVSDPLAENAAHALIVALPQLIQSGAQRRFRDALARISSWVILPVEIRDGHGSYR